MENDRGEDNITNGRKRPSLAQQPLQITETRGRTNGRILSQILGPNSTAHTYKRQLTNRWRIHISRNRDCQSQYANICRKPRRPQVNYIRRVNQINARRTPQQNMSAGESPLSNFPEVISKKLQQNSTRAIRHPPNPDPSKRNRQDDTLLQISHTQVATKNDAEDTQLTEIRRHAEKECRNILTPESECSQTVNIWYDRIHAYRQLIRLREGKANNARNIYRFARRNNIAHPEKLTVEEMEDGL